MEIIKKETVVNASLKRVFDYLENPANWPEFWSSLVTVSEVQPLPDGGYKANYQYKMAGRLFNGKGEYINYVPNQRIVISTKGGILSKLTFTFRSIPEKTNSQQTRITLTVEYEIPIPLLGKFAEIIIRKMNEQDIELLMANLNARFLLSY